MKLLWHVGEFKGVANPLKMAVDLLIYVMKGLVITVFLLFSLELVCIITVIS